MDIDKLTLGEIKEISKLIGSQKKEVPFEIGKAYFIRTVTYHFTGKLDKIVGDFLCFSKAAWIAESGRFMQCIEDGALNEVEPIGDWCVNINSITDFGEWKHDLPFTQK